MKFRKSVVLIAKGGLGNQLHSYMAAFVVARKLNSNLYVVAPRLKRTELRTREVGLEAFAFDEELNMEIKLIKFRGLSSLSWIKWKLILRLSYLNKKNLVLNSSSELNTLVNQPDNIANLVFLNAHFENAEFPQTAYRLGMPKEISLVDPSEQYLALYEYLTSKERPKVFGIHVRLGDFKTWSGGKFLLGHEYYKIHTLAYELNFPKAEFWIFSDEPETALTLMAPGINSRVISRDYLLTNAEELKLLSLTDGVIGSHGTFSWWGCYWNKNQESIVYPEPSMCLTGWIDINNYQH